VWVRRSGRLRHGMEEGSGGGVRRGRWTAGWARRRCAEGVEAACGGRSREARGGTSPGVEGGEGGGGGEIGGDGGRASRGRRVVERGGDGCGGEMGGDGGPEGWGHGGGRRGFGGGGKNGMKK
jgi:hypothetical protein